MLNGETEIREMDRRERKRGEQRGEVIAKTLLSLLSLCPLFGKAPIHLTESSLLERAHTHTPRMCVCAFLCWYCAFFMLIEIEWLSLSENTALK